MFHARRQMHALVPLWGDWPHGGLGGSKRPKGRRPVLLLSGPLRVRRSPSGNGYRSAPGYAESFCVFAAAPSRIGMDGR